MQPKESDPKRAKQSRLDKRAEKRDQDAELEKALEDTFPSSDPVSLTQPTIASKKKSPNG